MRDRYKVYNILKCNNIPTVRYFLVDRSQANQPPPSIIEELDYIIINGERLNKPFVEKPIDGEDHNIYIYHSQASGGRPQKKKNKLQIAFVVTSSWTLPGGVTKLFRKIDNKSSERFPNENFIRRNGSFIYEEFIDTQNAQDIKVYSVGKNYVHAESRKSPVVDGIVLRDERGREIRTVIELSDWEKEISRRVVMAFNQSVCGFDLLRSKDVSYVCDVNGWSFVKSNTSYYENCAQHLRDMFFTEMQWRGFYDGIPLSLSPSSSQNLCVIAEASSFPYQSLTLNFPSQLLQTHDFGSSSTTSSKDVNYETVFNKLSQLVQSQGKMQIYSFSVSEILSHLAALKSLEKSIYIDGKSLVRISWGNTLTSHSISQIRILAELFQNFYSFSSPISQASYFPSTLETAQTFVSAFNGNHPPNFELIQNSTPTHFIQNVQNLTQEDQKYISEIRHLLNEFIQNSLLCIKDSLAHGETAYLFQYRYAHLSATFFDSSTQRVNLSLLPQIFASICYDLIHNQAILHPLNLFQMHQSCLSLLSNLSQTSLQSPLSSPSPLLSRILHHLETSHNQTTLIFIPLNEFLPLVRSLLQRVPALFQKFPQPVYFNTLSYLLFRQSSPENNQKNLQVWMSRGETTNVFGYLAQSNQLSFPTPTCLHPKLHVKQIL